MEPNLIPLLFLDVHKQTKSVVLRSLEMKMKNYISDLNSEYESLNSEKIDKTFHYFLLKINSILNFEHCEKTPS